MFNRFFDGFARFLNARWFLPAIGVWCVCWGLASFAGALISADPGRWLWIGIPFLLVGLVVGALTIAR